MNLVTSQFYKEAKSVGILTTRIQALRKEIDTHASTVTIGTVAADKAFVNMTINTTEYSEAKLTQSSNRHEYRAVA